MLQLLEFQEKMERQVPIIVGAASPINYAETIVEVQRLVRWTITQPEKVRHYLNLCLEERLAALDFYRDVAAAKGCRFFCIFGGARTWGPRQLAQFGGVDRVFLEKARQIFPYVFWHHCGHNLPQALEALAEWPGIKGVQYDMPYHTQKLTWPEFYESVARLFAGCCCAMNSPTTQVACYGTPEEVRQMVRDFIRSTLPHTTAVVMPGCEIDSYAPLANVQAMIQAARESAGITVNGALSKPCMHHQ
jgi:uroporphyrinogen-III decarboxylase